MRSAWLAAACCWLLPAGVAAQSPAAAAPLTLADAVDRALAVSPIVAAARLQGPIDAAGVSVAGERPNPDVNYEASRETPKQAIGATLPLELGGKRQRRIEVAYATAAVGDAALARTIIEVRNDVRRAYFEAVAAALRAQIEEDIRGLAQRARDAANARAVAGDVPRSDLTLSDLALANSENDLTGARAEVAATLAELNTLLGQPVATSWTLTDTLSSGAMIPESRAVEMAVQANAEVALADKQIAEQAAKVNLAKALTVPDLSVGGTFTADAEPEFSYGWRVSGGVTVPVFTRHKAGVTVEETTLARMKQERAALVARVSGAISAAAARAIGARDQILRYETSILPLALASERDAQAAYTGGLIGLPVLVQSLQTARDTRHRGLQAGLDYQHALNELDRAIGAFSK